MPITIGGLNLYTTAEIAEKLGLHNQTVRAYMREGRIKGQKAGTRWYITEEALREFFESYLNETEEPRSLEEIFEEMKALLQRANELLKLNPDNLLREKIQQMNKILEMAE